MSRGEDYLQQYPQFRKWLNQCVSCQAIGLKPEMPEEVGTALYSRNTQETWHGVGANNLRRFFRPLPLDEHGLCEQCSANC